MIIRDARADDLEAIIALLDEDAIRAPAGEPEAREFYGGLLGLVEVAKPDQLAGRGGVWFRGDGYELHVGVEAPFVPARKAHPAFLVDALDACATLLAEHGHDVTWDNNFPAYRRFHTHDPHGNRVEILGVL